MTRYTITAHSTPGAKGRLRTALKIMGMEAIRIEEAEVDATKPKPKPDNVPTQPLSRAVADLYRRSYDTGWSDKELTAFVKACRAGMTLETLAEVAAHYKSERKKETHFCRHDLLTFLNNFPGELDRARAVKPKAGRQLEWTAANVITMPQQDPAEAERIRLATLAQIAERRKTAP